MENATLEITNQQISITSQKKGTTTDPVLKAMEFLNLGPCVLIDTPGFDDVEDNIGSLRIKKTLEILNNVEAAILVLENGKNLTKEEMDFLKTIKQKRIPLIVAINKIDLKTKKIDYKKILNSPFVELSAKTKKNINKLTDLIINYFKPKKENFLISDLINPKDLIVLVIVIDKEYPKARLILPQQQLINEVLKKGAFCYVLRDVEYEEFINNLKTKPKLIVVDSQIFDQIFKKTPNNYLITSFSILLARKKKVLKDAVKACEKIDSLKENDRILICESCTHKKTKCDLATVKIPKLIEKYTQKKFQFNFKTGVDFTKNPKKYSLIVHCAGCMTTTKKIQQRFNFCKQNKVLITNYGVLIAYLNGVLEKSISFLKKLKN